MTLLHELSTLPNEAVAVLNFMSHHRTDLVDWEMIQNGTGLSDRSMNKAVKRLVTRFFMSMDESRQYRLAPKGQQALDALASGEFTFDQVGTGYDFIPYDLCAVIPAQLPMGQSSAWMIGIHPTSEDVPPHPAQVYLRFNTHDGQISPSELTLEVSSQQPIASAELQIIPTSSRPQVRVRVEAIQFLDMDEPNEAGGMYFDVRIGGLTQEVRAIHIPILLI